MTNLPNPNRAISQIAKDWAHYFPTYFGPTLISLISSMIYTRIFPPQIYGIYTMAMVIASPIISLLSQFVIQPAGRYYYEYKTTDTLPIFLISLGKTLIRSLFALSVVAITVGGWMILHHNKYTSLAFLLMVYAAAQIGILSVQKVLIASFQSRLYRYSVFTLSFLALTISLLLIGYFGKTIILLIWGNALSALLVLILLSALFIKNGRQMIQTKPHSLQVHQTVRRFIRYSLPFLPWFIAEAMLSSDEKYVLLMLGGIGLSGIYNVNFTLAQQGIRIIISPLLTAAGPRIIQNWKLGKKEQTQSLISQLTTIYILLTGLFVGILFAVGRPLLTLLIGKSYVVGNNLVGIIGLGSAIWSLSVLGQKSMELHENTWIMVVDGFIGVGFGLLLSFILVPRQGAIGAAISSTMAYSVYTMMIWYHSKSTMPWNISIKLLLKVGVGTSMSVIISHSLVACANENLEKVLFRSLSCIIVYIILLSLFSFKELRQVSNLKL